MFHAVTGTRPHDNSRRPLFAPPYVNRSLLLAVCASLLCLARSTGAEPADPAVQALERKIEAAASAPTLEEFSKTTHALWSFAGKDRSRRGEAMRLFCLL